MKTFSLAIPQNKETPVTYTSIGKFHFRYAYARSKDAQDENEKGEDSLWLGANEDRFVFVLCDGVGPSFFGDLAAQFLAGNLGAWLLQLDMGITEASFKNSLSNKLVSLSIDADTRIRGHQIPEDLPALVRDALETKRARIGSQSTFVAGVIDTQTHKAFFAWMGDSLLQIWKPDAALIELPENTFTRSEGWSSRTGLIGELHVRSVNVTELAHLVTYSDGLSPLKKLFMDGQYISYDSLQTGIGDLSTQPSSDDISFLELWCIDQPDEFDERTVIPFADISDLFVEKKVREHSQSRILLSYEHDDRDKARKLYHMLDNDGYDVWMDSECLLPDQERSSEISRRVRDANVILVLLSDAAFSDNRRVIEKVNSILYYDLANVNEKTTGIVRIIPVRLEACEVPYPLRHFQWVDLFAETGYEKLKMLLERRDDQKPVPMASPPPLAAPPPPLAAPPPRSIRYYALVSIAAILIFMLLGFVFTSYSSNLVASPSQRSPFWGQIATIAVGLFIASILSLVPTIAAMIVGFKNKVKLSIAEIVGFSIVILVITYYLFGLQGNSRWIYFAIFTIAFLDIGAHLIDWFRESTFRRIDKTWQYKSLRKDAASFDKLYNYERILYAALPLGIILGTFLGVFQKTTNAETALLSMRAVALSAFLLLILITFKSVQQMITPMYHLPNPPSKPPVFTSKQREDIKNKEEKMFSLAIMSTDLRKLYLYDSTHNTLLMFLFAYSFLVTYGFVFELKCLVASIMLATLLFSQLPYIWGQYLLHQKVCEPFEGLPREDVKEKIMKYAPLFPKFHFLGALITNGTAGGLAYFLLDNFIKGVLK